MPVNAYSLPDLLSFTARTLEGGSFSASDLSGADLTVINIWSTTCGPCIREMPELAEFASGLPENIRVMTWCIDAEYSPDGGQVAQFLDDCGFTGVTLTSGDGDMQVLLDNLMYTPTTVFLDSTGHLLSEPLIGAGDIEAKYTEQINAGLRKLGKDTI
jgi:thiol-disulfide isomerase/thioredoxin